MTQKISILLVEDNEDERVFMKEGFISSGLYEVIAEAANGDELMQLVHDPSFIRPQLVMSDLNMPGKDGYDVILDIKTDPSLKSIGVIVLSSAPDVPFAEKCKKLGACRYYTKPDTFLEYESFARSIYSEVRNCIID